jgi:hypothetical protein
MSEQDKLDTVLGALTGEQLSVLLAKLRQSDLVKTQTHDPAHIATFEHFYGHIVRYGEFETFVSYNDAKSTADARAYAISNGRLQSWYFVEDDVDRIDRVTAKQVSRNEFCDWLRESCHVKGGR